MDKDVHFGTDDVTKYRHSGVCPHCGATIEHRGNIKKPSDNKRNDAEQRNECIICGLVFYAKYKLTSLEFDGWMYGGKDARGIVQIKSEDDATQQSGGSDGPVDTPPNGSKRSVVGGRGRRRSKRKTKAGTKSKHR